MRRRVPGDGALVADGDALSAHWTFFDLFVVLAVLAGIVLAVWSARIG